MATRQSNPAVRSRGVRTSCCHGGGEATGPGGRAVGVDESLKAANLRQLRRIEGQIRGIASMIEDDRYCADIIAQVAAARGSLHTVARTLLRNHLHHCAAAAFDEDGEARDDMIDELVDLVGRLGR